MWLVEVGGGHVSDEKETRKVAEGVLSVVIYGNHLAESESEGSRSNNWF